MRFLKRGRSRAQTSTEFMVIIAAMIFSLVAFFVIIQRNIEQKNSEREQNLVNEVALSVKEEISLAHESSNGYFRQFKTPLNLLGVDYDLNITNEHIYVHTKNHAVSYKIQPVVGQIRKGLNNITKINDTIYLNQ